MTQTTQTSQAKYEATARRIESQHEELLQRLDELEKRVQDALAEWANVADGEGVSSMK